MEEGETVEIQETRERFGSRAVSGHCWNFWNNRAWSRKKGMCSVWQTILILWKCSWELS